MIFLIAIISIYIFFQGISYSIYEFKDNNNKVACICMVILSIIALIFPTVMFYIR